MKFGCILLVMALLASCSSTGYNRSFIMGQVANPEVDHEPVTQLERNVVKHKSINPAL